MITLILLLCKKRSDDWRKNANIYIPICFKILFSIWISAKCLIQLFKIMLGNVPNYYISLNIILCLRMCLFNMSGLAK